MTMLDLSLDIQATYAQPVYVSDSGFFCFVLFYFLQNRYLTAEE